MSPLLFWQTTIVCLLGYTAHETRWHSKHWFEKTISFHDRYPTEFCQLFLWKSEWINTIELEIFFFPFRRWTTDFSFWNYICKNNFIFHFLTPRMLTQEKALGGGGTWIYSHSYSLSPHISLCQIRKRWFFFYLKLC